MQTSRKAYVIPPSSVLHHPFCLRVSITFSPLFFFCIYQISSLLIPGSTVPSDRRALLLAATSGSPKFFLGSDSAPHDISAKKGLSSSKIAAGVFTQPYCTQLVLGAFEEAIERGVIKENAVTKEILEAFLGGHGRKFYGIDGSKERIVLRKGQEVVIESLKGEGVEVVPFRRGAATWSVEWK